MTPKQKVDLLIGIAAIGVGAALWLRAMASSVAFIVSATGGLLSREGLATIVIAAGVVIIVKHPPPMVIVILGIPIIFMMLHQIIFLIITPDRALWPVAIYTSWLFAFIMFYLWELKAAQHGK